MPKIVFYLGSLAKGGAERVVVNLAEYLNSKGWNVTIVTKLQEKDEYEICPNITRLLADIEGDEISKSRVTNLIRRIKKLRNIWLAIQPDIIVSFIGKNNFLAITSAKGLKIPVVCSVRSAPEREYKSPLMRMLLNPMFKRASGIILQTQDALEFFPPYIQKKAVILQNPINPLFIRDRYLGQREDKIVTVGRIDDNKNQKMLVDAFAKITKDYPNMQLEIIGDGSSRKSLEEHVKGLGIEEKVTFAGNQVEIHEKIYQSRIFVLTSKMEGMPNALIEAMALGLAVISTNCPSGGPRTIIQQNENGILIPVDDVEQLVIALKNILDNPELEEKLGINAHELGKKLAPEKVNANWQEYLENIMLSKR